MGFVILFIIECLTGFFLFSKNLIHGKSKISSNSKVSVIIPARNEEKNLPHILGSLSLQSFKPYEIIVVNDFSEDATRATALEYNAKVIENTELPEGWTGKTWAVWNGFLNSSGNILVFLDADVRLAPNSIEALLKAREKAEGAISVVPFHHTEKFFEKLCLIPNILGMFAFTSPFEKTNPDKGLYGSCIVCTREDYEKINGHNSISSELLDDLSLGRRFVNAGIPVENFIGSKLVAFRMYPQGIVSALQGFGKGAILSTGALRFPTLFLIILWLVGILTVGLLAPILLLKHSSLFLPFSIGYLIYVLQIFYLQRHIGNFGIVMPVLHFLSSIFFIIVVLYSFYQVAFLGRVTWKGRNISVRRGRNV